VPSPPKPARRLLELVASIATAVFFALVIQAYAVKPYRIPSESMYPTLKVGQRVVVNRFAHRIGGAPHIGDITVFTPPAGATEGRCGIAGEGPDYGGPASNRSCMRPTPQKADTTFVKRIVAGPGDTIAVRDGHVVRNGRLADEPFASTCDDATCNLAPITVPAGHWFLMGDNRGNSEDSRFWGPIPQSWIIGKAVVTYWPPNRVGGV
jgi:signal peptidase I